MATVEQIDNRKRVLEFIENFPSLHDQADYLCSTAACICGTAIMLDACDNSIDKVQGILRSGNGNTDLIPNYEEDDLLWEFNRGSELLGLDEEEAKDLFYTWTEAGAVAKLRALANEKPTED